MPSRSPQRCSPPASLLSEIGWHLETLNLNGYSLPSEALPITKVLLLPAICPCG